MIRRFEKHLGIGDWLAISAITCQGLILGSALLRKPVLKSEPIRVTPAVLTENPIISHTTIQEYVNSEEPNIVEITVDTKQKSKPDTEFLRSIFKEAAPGGSIPGSEPTSEEPADQHQQQGHHDGGREREIDRATANLHDHIPR